MIERYNDIELDREEFINKSLIFIINKCMLKAKWLCLYIPEDMYNDMKKYFNECDKILKFKVNNTKIHNIYCWKGSNWKSKDVN